MTAKQLRERVKGPTGTFSCEGFEEEQGEIPSSPNAYKDGSSNAPETMIGALAGAGVCWPDRRLTEWPATKLEAESADVKGQ